MKDDLINKRQRRLSGLITRPELSDPHVDVVHEFKSEYCNYAIKIDCKDLEFLRKYAFSKGIIKGVKVPIAEVISDALKSLRDNNTIELLELPEWELRRLEKKSNK